MFFSKIQRFIHRVKHWKEVIFDSFRGSDAGWGTRLHYSLLGFTYDYYRAFGFPDHDPDQYISSWDLRKTKYLNGDYNIIPTNKIIAEEVFGKYVTIPHNFALSENGIISALHDWDISNENFLSFIEEKNGVFIKRIDGRKGEGAHSIHVENQQIRIDHSLSDEKHLNEILSDGTFLIGEEVHQSEQEAAYYPKSVNSIRIVCGKKRGEKEAHVLADAQRIGTDESMPADNLSKGGLAAEIELETGRLHAAYALNGKWANKRFEKHPETGTQIMGEAVPGFRQICKDLEEITTRFPYLKFIAWDIVLTPDGYCVLEGNGTSGTALFQMEKGAKGTPLWDFFESWGLLNNKNS